MSVTPWDEYTQWDYKIAYRRFLDDMDAEICPWTKSFNINFIYINFIYINIIYINIIYI